MNKQLLLLVFVAQTAFGQYALASQLPKSPPDASAASAKAGGGKGAPPLLVVDSAGTTLGLYASAKTAVLSYNNALMAVLLGEDYDANANFVSGGFNWPNFNRVFTSFDCSGTPYFNINAYGTRYIGLPVIESGQQVISVVDTSLVADVEFNSFYNGSAATCDPQTSTTRLAPSVATIPAASLGTAPFWLK